MGRWIELTQDCLSAKNAADLNIVSEEDAAHFAEKIDLATYIERGLAIGNFANKDGDVRQHSPKFIEMLKIARGKRAVFYSNFTKNGIDALKDFFDSEKESYEYLDIGMSGESKKDILDRFRDAHKSRSQFFLLLHPSYSEGVSIFGAEQFHILEPITYLAKKEQAIARAVRYLSHTHLPKSQQKVVVIQWTCENKTAVAAIKKTAVSFAKWFKLNAQVNYGTDYTKFKQDATPDSVVMKRELISQTNEKDILALLANVPKPNINCCIAYPSETQEETCMRRTKRRCAAR
jgi:hypothetical protein